MFLFGSGYRVLATRLAAPVTTTPIADAVLQQLPQQIGDWTGQEVPLDDEIVRATDTDAHVSRRYSCHGGLESAYLYIACGVKARDLMPHRPEVCYTGNGWTLEDRDSVELPLSDGARLPCNILQFSRGTLDTKAVVVLDYYIVDGQYCPDVSLLRSKAWRGSGVVQYVAQVEIVAAVMTAQMADSAVKLVSAFATDSASSIMQLFQNPEEDQSTGRARGSSEGE
jgi:EpsI family protein